MLKNLIYNTSLQKVLYFLLSHPNDKYFDREIARLSKVSKASANFALRDLTSSKLISREKKGRMYFYYVDINNPVVRQLKIAQNLVFIHKLIETVKPHALRIVLYGSSYRGDNSSESDIDLYILTRTPKKIKDIIYKNSSRRMIQYLIMTPLESAKLKKDNPTFAKEISNGLILYESK
ncbi:MAG: nucleotidyltransferase domain-containing protein [Candidatus Omnitrophota bacterium]